MSAAAVMITTVTLLALGAVLVAVGTLDHIVRTLERQLEVVVYLREGVTAAQAQGLRARLLRLPGVTHVAYISKGEALARLQQMLGGQADVQDLASRNPLPDSFVLTADRPSRLRSLAAAAQGFPPVQDTSYGEKDVSRLLAAIRLVRAVGAVAIGLLAFVALIIITSTIRLTVFARRAEIEVMRLVGATAWFIRWPFVVEGGITGACGALAAFVIVTGAYSMLARGAQATLASLPLLTPGQVALAVSWKLLFWGVSIGVLGSLLAVRRYLQI